MNTNELAVNYSTIEGSAMPDDSFSMKTPPLVGGTPDRDQGFSDVETLQRIMNQSGFMLARSQQNDVGAYIRQQMEYPFGTFHSRTNDRPQIWPVISFGFGLDLGDEEPVVEIDPELAKLPQDELIRRIHYEFEGAANELLIEANRVLSAPKSRRLEKAERLILLGFTQAKPVTDEHTALGERRRVRQLQKRVAYYQGRYPNSSFITEKQVQTICKKYGLVKGQASLYKGDVPDHCLEQMEAFTLDPVDAPGLDAQIMVAEGKTNYKPSLQICATKDQMDMRFMRVAGNGYDLVQEDPVVLCPVLDGYLILAAWGPEALDENVINPKQN